MIKKLFFFLIALAIVGGGAYWWWQTNAMRIIKEQVRAQVIGLFANPENLVIAPDPIPMQLTGWKTARVGEMNLSGKELILKNGLKLAETDLQLTEIDVSGPPFRLVDAKGKSFRVKIADTVVTEMIRSRGFSFSSARVSLSAITVKFTGDGTAIVQGDVPMPFGKKLVLVAPGKLVPATQPGKIDFRVDSANMTVNGQKNAVFPIVADMLNNINPIIDMTSLPVKLDNIKIDTTEGFATVSGDITGIKPSLGL